MSRVTSCRRLLCSGLCLLGLPGCTTVPSADLGDEWEPASSDWQLVWSDEFAGPAGSAPDPSKWAPFVRGCNYNDEMQFYTDRPENLFVDGAGNLVIRAVSERYDDNHAFTSGRLETLGSMEQQYGAFEARIKLPRGKGLWPAFWLLGNDYKTRGWPYSGEVDILEMAGSDPYSVSSALHVLGYCGGGDTDLCDHVPVSRSRELPGGASYADDFHTFRFEWGNDGLRWLIDGVSYHERSKENLAKIGHPWPFDHPFFMILNVAVGGKFDGNPDSTTVFPQEMVVDYVRIYQLPGSGAQLVTGTPVSTDDRPDFPNVNCVNPTQDPASGGAAGAAGAAGEPAGGAGGESAGGTGGVSATPF